MDLLDNTIQPYAWGSRTAIAELLGLPSPSPSPQAELWMGAHPSAPSRVRRAGATRSLAELIAEDPRRELGPRVAEAFGPHLPFLLKVLAADTPLSLQAHPSEEQAARGYDADDAAGIPLDAPHRNYKDRHHKPELICALTPFDALCGFREIAATRALLSDLAVPALDALCAPLRAAGAGPDAVRASFAALLELGPDARAALISATLAACARHRAARGPFAEECAWALRLGELYPGDVGAVSALLLNHVRLAPGEAIYLPAGNLHAYLRGVGVEVMANSDNVLRGGCTPKHVNVGELLRVLDFRAGAVPQVRPSETGEGNEQVYDTPAREFRLSRIAPGGAGVFRARVRGPEILLCTAGRVVAREDGGEPVALARGASAFVPGSTAGYTLEGDGAVYRATVGEVAATA